MSGMIHCSTEEHDLDQGLVMDPAQREREGDGGKIQQEKDGGKVCVDSESDAWSASHGHLNLHRFSSSYLNLHIIKNKHIFLIRP